MSEPSNPFERYGLDPKEGIAGITARFKELIEDATDEEERTRLRAVWEELTLHPARRLRAALLAHPDTRPGLGAPPPRLRVRVRVAKLELADLCARPSVEAALAGAAEVRGESTLASDRWLRRP